MARGPRCQIDPTHITTGLIRVAIHSTTFSNTKIASYAASARSEVRPRIVEHEPRSRRIAARAARRCAILPRPPILVRPLLRVYPSALLGRGVSGARYLHA